MKGLRRLILGLCVLPAALALAETGSPSTPVTLNIAAQPLDRALNEFAQQTGLQLIFRADQVGAQLTSRPLAGKFEAEEALRLLLKDSGLAYRYLNERTIAVQPKRVSGRTGDEQRNAKGVLRLSQVDDKGRQNLRKADGSAPARDAGDSPAAAELDVSKVQEIIVTAQKREQKLLETPIAVSAFTGEKLEAIGASDLTDFLQQAPGATIIDLGNGEQQIFMRGIASLYGDGAVGYYLDEVPFNLIGVTSLPDVRTFDLERVEVLRGPQGTLYGTSSLGGTVRILTKDPVFNEFQAKVNVSGSSTERGGENYGLKGAVNLPLVDDRLALRLVGTSEHYDGWLDEPINGRSDVNDHKIETVRAKLRWKIGESANLVLGGWSYKNESGDDDTANDRGEAVDTRVPGVLNPRTLEYRLLSANLTIATRWFDIVSSTSYMDTDSTTGGATTTLRPADTFAEELRLSSNSQGPWAWTAGVFYRDLTTKFLFQSLPFPPTVQDTASESYAVFGEATYSFSPKWDVTLGMRYFEDTRNRNDTVVLGPTTSVAVAFEEKYSAVSPRLNLAYRPNEDTLFYANFTKGFRSGFQQPGISLYVGNLLGLDVGPGADPETAWSYEIGSKAQFADSRLVVEAALYYIDWDNLQTVITVVPGALGAILNAGKASARGVDFSITAVPTKGLELALTGNVNKSQYGEDVVDTVGIVVSKGQQTQLVPKTTVTASASYRWPMGTHGLYGIGYLDVQHTSPRTLNFGVVTTESDAITQGNLRLGVETAKWGAYLFAENLLDDDGMTSGPSPSAFYSDAATRLRPRTVGLNVRFDF